MSSKLIKNAHVHYFCKNCLNHFIRQDILDNHYEYCLKKEAIKIEMPKPGSIVQFKQL